MTIGKESTQITLLLNFLPCHMLLCTFSSHKVPKLIQSHLRFPPSPSQILPLCPGISKVLFYLTSFWNASSPSVLKRSAWISPALKPFWGKALLFVYLTLYFHPAILASCHLSLSPSYKNPCSLELLLIRYIILSLYWFQSSAKPLLVYNHVLLVHKFL